MSKANLVLFVVFILILLAVRCYYFYQHTPIYVNGELLTVSARIKSEPIISGKTQRFSIGLSHGAIAFITTMKYPFYAYGQQIDVTGKLRITQKDGNQILALAYPKIRNSAVKQDIVSATALNIRQKAIMLFQSILSPVDAGLLLGIVFGIKQNMPDAFMEQLRSAGVMHVIAASGMNVSMVAGALIFIFQRFLRRRTALVVSMVGVILYTFIAGMEPSIIRAIIMAGITFAAGIGGRQKTPFYALFLTAVFMLLFNPGLLFDVGFQLSFLATFGILSLKPLFVFLERGTIGALVGGDLTTTLAAQIATFPVLLVNFGSVNLLSVAINLLVLWVIPPLMVLGGVGALTGLFFKPLTQILMYLALPFLWYFESIVALSAKVSLPLQMEAVPLPFWLGYYILLTAVFLFYNEKAK
jgi:competence protein ComEC